MRGIGTLCALDNAAHNSAARFDKCLMLEMQNFHIGHGHL